MSTLRCLACGYQWPVRDPAILGVTEEEHRRKAQELADVGGLDLATAYSVLLELIPMRDARAIAESVAVDRNRSRDDPPARKRKKTPSSNRGSAALAIGALSLFVAGIVATGWWVGSSALEMDRAAEQAAETRASAVLETVDVEFDSHGDVITVTAHDARLVLLGYCGVGAQSRCEPLEIVHPGFATAGVRHGVFRYSSKEPTRYAIDIRRDGAAQRWVAGNHLGPIEVLEVPAAPDGTAAIPVVY